MVINQSVYLKAGEKPDYICSRCNLGVLLEEDRTGIEPISNYGSFQEGEFVCSDCKHISSSSNAKSKSRQAA
jgi:hypothetical protein